MVLLVLLVLLVLVVLVLLVLVLLVLVLLVLLVLVLVVLGLKRRIFVLGYHKRHFPGLNCLEKKSWKNGHF